MGHYRILPDTSSLAFAPVIQSWLHYLTTIAIIAICTSGHTSARLYPVFGFSGLGFGVWSVLYCRCWLGGLCGLELVVG